MTRPLLLAISVALLTVGCASAPQSRPDAATGQASAAVPAKHLTCVTSTGSRIQRKDDECSGLPGRSYSKDDLDSTGAVSVSDALRRLDPALSGGR